MSPKWCRRDWDARSQSSLSVPIRFGTRLDQPHRFASVVIANATPVIQNRTIRCVFMQLQIRAGVARDIEVVTAPMMNLSPEGSRWKAMLCIFGLKMQINAHAAMPPAVSMLQAFVYF